MSVPAGARQDMASVTVTVTKGSETRKLGVFDKRGGGALDSEESKYRPGNMGDQVSLGGYRTVENVTVERLYVASRDQELIRWLWGAIGCSDAVVQEQDLDCNRNAWGQPKVWRGIVKAVTPTERDSDSADPGLFTIEISTHSTFS